MFRFARRIDKIEVSGIRKMFELAPRLRDPIDLSLGQAHFDPPDEVKEAINSAVKNRKNRYTITQGIPELREMLADHFTKKHDFKIGPENILITSGASAALLLSFIALVEEGEEVLLTDPCFVLYPRLTYICSATPRYIDTYPDFRLRPEVIERSITPKTRLLLINTPNNPTGIAYTKDEIKAIAQVAKKHNLMIISDEVYEDFIYDFPHETMLKNYEWCVYIGAFSKTYGIAGWRLGYVIAAEVVIERLIALQQFSIVCANAPGQFAMLKALDCDMKPYFEQYRRKRDMVFDGLKDLFFINKPQGAFYAFPQVPWGDDRSFTSKAIEHNLLIVPGSVFSSRNTNFRLSFAVDDDKLSRGIDILRKIAQSG
jgi:aspartate aminotransferase/aminotransferase